MENLEEKMIESPETEQALSEVSPEPADQASPEGEDKAPGSSESTNQASQSSLSSDSCCGRPVDPESVDSDQPARPAQGLEERIAALEEALARQTEQYMQREQDLALRQHFSSLEKQAEELRESFPDFDLMGALDDPMFVKLTSPEVGLPVNVAYFAVNYRQLNEANARAAAEKLGNSLQAGRNMPSENGSIQRAAPDGSYRPLAELSPEERKLRMDMIRSGKLRFD